MGLVKWEDGRYVVNFEKPEPLYRYWNVMMEIIEDTRKKMFNDDISINEFMVGYGMMSREVGIIQKQLCPMIKQTIRIVLLLLQPCSSLLDQIVL